MKYIVLDLEFNQAFDFGSNSTVTDERCPFEIIQIGAVRLNHKFEFEASLNLLIKPVIYKRIHPYVGRITGLSAKDLTDKQSFCEAFEKLVEFAGKKRAIYCVWGVNDIKELRKNMDYYDLGGDDRTIDFLDVQAVASRHLNRVAGMCIGLKNALNALDIEMVKPFHDALNDAEYTAKILQRLKREPLPLRQFSHDHIVTAPKPPRRTGFAAIYRFVEGKLGRALTRKERWVFKNVFILNIRTKRFTKKNL